MNGRLVALGVAVTAAGVLCVGGTAVATVTAWLADQKQPTPVDAACGTTTVQPAVRPVSVKVSGWSGEQVTNAATIVRVGQQMGVPPRGWVIAVATAIQESSLRNLGNLGARNDHDSLGLFQQRPSQGWGTPAQVMDPTYASRKFYERLLAVPGWASLSLTAAAQRVQRSAFPNAYAKHEPAAAALVNAASGGAAQTVATQVGRCAAPGEVTAGGWTVPVRGEVVSGFRTAERPNHQGVDLAAPKRTVIRAAASGTVIKAICDTSTIRTRGSCDVDGSPQTKGCGWYVDIAHAAGVITRYCHMIVRPLVSAGQPVAAGQQIGWSGTSGNSSGPHVHFEIHTGGDGHASGATNPVPWMRAHGATLGSLA